MNSEDVPSSSADETALAKRVADEMYRRDQASRNLGMRLLQVGAGRCSLSMRVREDMLNGHDTCHGGFIFAVADSAFAFACNSRNHSTVAAGCTIDYVSPGRVGEVLEAHAQEVVLAGRTGVYDVTVRGEDGRTVAVFRGRSHRIRGEVLLIK